ncbi:MAG: hypothetical protein JW818_11780 [Pirellulales bacterium]|nr:hypothetical protein [Pirellulales bacterium]
MSERDLQDDPSSGSGTTELQPSCSRRATDDRELVDHCLAGDETAWEKLYYRCHPALIKAIRYLLDNDNRDLNLVEEIAARVWYLLLKNDGELLGRFDPERDCRLQAYLIGFARNEILQYLRAERRRRSHEATGGRLLLAGQRSSHWPIHSMIDEFAATLNEREQEFLESYLLTPPTTKPQEPAEPELSPTNIWQRRHRLRFKLKAFMKGQ